MTTPASDPTPPTADQAAQPLKRAAFLGNPQLIERVYGPEGLERARALADVRPGILDAADWSDAADAQWIFSTWGMPTLSPEQLDQLPHLEAVFYAAGSIRYFAEPFLQRGIAVVSARAANAVPVAEFTLAQILLSCKAYFANTRATRTPWGGEERRKSTLPTGQGVWDTPVALLGFGVIARLLAEHLRRFRIRLMVVDPLVDPADLEAYGAEAVTMEQAFAQAEVVSNHLPNLPSTQGLITGKHFEVMPQGATFINTGRGAQIIEPDMIRVLQQRPDITALLDVTDPEPPRPDSPLLTMPNVFLSSHIAGSQGRELRRMAELVLEDAQRVGAGQPPQQAVTLDMLEHMA